MRDYKFVVRPNTKGQWSWRLVAPNGETVAWTGETYINKSHCVRMVNKIASGAMYAPIEVIEPKRKVAKKPVKKTTKKKAK